MSKRAKKEKSRKLIGVEFPVAHLPALARAVRKVDSDRSKFIRQAVREKCAAVGITLPENEA